MAYEDLATALIVDLFVLVLCSVLLLRYGRLAHSHPAITYLIFHALVVPSRLLAILAGAETLFSQLPGFWEPVSEVEIVRATVLADLTLIIMTIAWIRASVVDNEKHQNQPRQNNTQPITLSLQHIWRVALLALPIGIVGLFLLGNIPGLERPEIDLGEWQESSWPLITMTWAGLALLALIYWYGFRWWLLTPTLIYLAIIAIQGYSRVRFIVPLILLIQIYLDRRGRKWPSTIIVVMMIVTLVLFFPLKQIGRMTQTGATFSEIKDVSMQTISEAMAGKHGDETLLDQFASSLTLIDRAGKFYYGTTYLAIVTAPLPRQWWPEKPGMADYLKDFSTPGRPMDVLGMVMSFIGEFYLNFGYIGIVLLSYLFAYWLARIYFRAYRANYFSVLRFGYLLIACNLIQIYRDGLMSLIVFTLVNMMPLAVIVVLHRIIPKRSMPNTYIPVPYQHISKYTD